MKTSPFHPPAGLLLAGLLLACHASAATRTWDGSSSGNWGTGANWAGGSPPAPGDDLVFPTGVARKSTTNTFAAGTSFRTITIQDVGYTLYGNSVVLTGDADRIILALVTANNGSSTVNLDLTLGGGSTQLRVLGGLNGAANQLLMNGDVNFNSHSLFSRYNVRWAGSLSGSGTFNTEPGVATLAGATANTFTGDTHVNAASQLVLLKNAGVNAVPGDLIANNGAVVWGADHQMSNAAQIWLQFNGSLDLAGHLETVATLKSGPGGQVGGGTLTVTGDLLFDPGVNSLGGGGAIAFPTGSHQISSASDDCTNVISLELTGAGNLIQQRGELHLSDSNSFTGTFAVTNGILFPAHSHALGSGPAGTYALSSPEDWVNRCAVVLSGGVSVTGETLYLSGPGRLIYPGSLTGQGGLNYWNGNVILQGTAEHDTFLGTADPGAELLVNGVISGTGDLRIVAPLGRVTFMGSSPNTYTGLTSVIYGQLDLAKSTGPAVLGDLSIGNGFPEANPDRGVHLRAHNQIANPATVEVLPDCALHMEGFSDTIANLNCRAATPLVLANGTLTLTGWLRADNGAEPCSVPAPGRLNLTAFVEHEFQVVNGASTPDLDLACEISGAASILKSDAGTLRLSGSNSFAGDLVVAAGVVEPRHAWALGAASAGTIVSNGAAVLLSQGGLSFAAEPLELRGHGVGNTGALRATADATWAGPIAVASFGSIGVSSNQTLTLSGAISAPEQLWLRGGGRHILSGAANNHFANGLVLRQGAASLAKSGGGVAVDGFLYVGDPQNTQPATCDLLGAGQFDPSLTLIVPPSGRLNLNGHNATVKALHGASADDGGRIALAGATLTLDDQGQLGYDWAGVIEGAGGVTKRGAGSLQFLGANTYTGTTLVQQGGLTIQGVQPASPVVVLNGAVLHGAGTVGHLTVNAGGTVLPGYYAFTPAALTCSNLVMQPGSTNWIEITPTEGYTWLNVRGSVSLSQPTLRLEVANYPTTYLPVVGETIVPIQNDGVESVTGTFLGLSGGPFSGPGNVTWDVAYGNDVVLKVISQGVASGTPSGANYLDTVVTGGNANGWLDPNECAGLRIPLFNDGTNARPAFTAYLSCAVPGVLVHQPRSDYPALAPGQGAYGGEPFQITTPPGLFCGSNLPLTLTLVTTGQPVYQLPASVFVGGPEAATRFDATDVPLPINDGVTFESSLNVDDFPGWLARVEVAVHAAHALTSDLHFTLVAPDGTEVPLVAKAGNGANFGAGCGDAQRTHFTMSAAQWIGTASAPFVGSYRPEGNLNVLRGLPGDLVAGKWILRVNDDTHFNTGTLQCWSLYLSPATCSDGGGACEICPGWMTGDVNEADPVAPQFTGAYWLPSACYTNRPCGGVVNSPTRYQVHNFTNHSAESVCVSATLHTDCTNAGSGLVAVAFAGAFNPALPCAGYLGESGYDIGQPTRTFAFTMPGQTTLQIVVATIPGSEGCKGYSLLVDGVGLCPVTLNIKSLAPDRMRLDWPTYALGYDLQRTTTLSPAGWATVATPPVVTNGRQVVTNTVATPNGFYRLHKP